MEATSAAMSLAQDEAIIEQYLDAYIEAGRALIRIRDGRKYIKQYGTFEEYCLNRWGFSDSRARQLMIAVRTVTTVTVGGLPMPANEAQARELARIPEPRRAKVWQHVIEESEAETEYAGRAIKPSAEMIRGIADGSYCGMRHQGTLISDRRRASDQKKAGELMAMLAALVEGDWRPSTAERRSLEALLRAALDRVQLNQTAARPSK